MFKKLWLFSLICMCILIHGCADCSENSSTNNTSPNRVEYSINLIQWINLPFSWDARNIEEEKLSISTDIWLDDDKLQETVAEFDIVYPLSTNEQIAHYAHQLCYVLEQNEYFESSTDAVSDIVPKRATHFSDGIWCIEFMRNLPGVSYDGIVFEAIISELDGHVIYFYQCG